MPFIFMLYLQIFNTCARASVIVEHAHTSAKVIAYLACLNQQA